MHHNILHRVNDYYTQKINAHGPTPQGVDWNSLASQNIRFDVLSSLFKNDTAFSVLDYGCGYGSLFEYMQQDHPQFTYTGFDVSPAMISTAKSLYSLHANAQWVNELDAQNNYHYTVASGIFNVKFDTPNDIWQNYILDTLQQMNRLSSRGFAFNVLSNYADKERMRNDLYYADPLFLFDYCKHHFSKQVALLHDYNLYEFTLRITKE